MAILQLRYWLLGKFATGQLYATDVATCAWHLKHAGLSGFDDLSFDPESPWLAKNASRKVSQAAEICTLQQQLYTVDLPMSQEDGQRIMVPTPMRLLHETLAEEFQEDPAAGRSARKAVVPGLFEDNEVATANPDKTVVPFGHFVDGAPFRAKGTSGSASALCYYVNILGSATRRVLLTLNKDTLRGERCGCPCRGRCTIAAAERVLSWSAEFAAKGVYPTCRHDGLPFSDPARAKLAGQPLVASEQVCFCMMQFRADWEQYSAGLGMPWPLQRQFCFLCNCTKNDRYNFHQEDLWTRRSHEMYCNELENCEVSALVSQTDWAVILGNLMFDRRKQGVHGRCVAADLELSLIHL